MKKILSLTMCLLLVLGVFSGCGQQSAQSGDQITLNVYNWGQYIADGSYDSLDVIAAFEEAYPNIKVNYSTFDSN